MKRFLILFAVVFAIIPSSWAHVTSTIAWYLESTDTVCIAKVTDVAGDKITFVITDVLLGNPQHQLQLSRYPDSENYSVNSEWLLVSVPTGFKDCVGWAMKGDCEWIPAALHTSGATKYAQDWTSNTPHLISPPMEPLDTAADGTRGLSLDHVRQILNRHSK